MSLKIQDVLPAHGVIPSVYFLPRPNLGSLISGSCFNPLAMPLPSSALYTLCRPCILSAFGDGMADGFLPASCDTLV